MHSWKRGRWWCSWQPGVTAGADNASHQDDPDHHNASDQDDRDHGALHQDDRDADASDQDDHDADNASDQDDRDHDASDQDASDQDDQNTEGFRTSVYTNHRSVQWNVLMCYVQYHCSVFNVLMFSVECVDAVLMRFLVQRWNKC